MSSGRCLGFSQTLWAHGGTSWGPLLAMGSLWSPSLVAFTLSSVASLQHYSLQGTHPSLYPNSQPGSTAGPTTTLLGAVQAFITHLAACTSSDGKVQFRTSVQT
jgi:hypothetical protein